MKLRTDHSVTTIERSFLITIFLWETKITHKLEVRVCMPLREILVEQSEII